MQQTAGQAIAEFVAQLLQNAARRPLIIALNGPQGIGKTYACAEACHELEVHNRLRGISISIDDFYLARKEQVALALAHPNNQYLQQRGYPGTHDIALGNKTLSALVSINSSDRAVPLPGYDKSAYSGDGDRQPEQDWRIVSPPLDFVLLEGWMLGFVPVGEPMPDDRSLGEIDYMLEAYSSWYAFFDAMVQMRTDDITSTISWRIGAEAAARSAGRGAMDEQKISEYIRRFLPAYAVYLPRLWEKPPQTPTLVLQIAKDRSLITAQVTSVR